MLIGNRIKIEPIQQCKVGHDTGREKKDEKRQSIQSVFIGRGGYGKN